MAKVVVSKELLDALAQHINAKAGVTGAKTIAQLQGAVDALSVMTLEEYAQDGWPDAVVSSGDVNTIRACAFYANTALTAVDFPNAVTVKERAFQLCSNLASFNFAKVTTIESYAFSRCGALSGALILPQVKFGSNVGTYSFEYCTSITSVSAPVTNLIPHSCFARCTALESISLPQASTFNDWCFSYCSALKEVTLPEAKSFRRYTFASSGLEKLVLPGDTVVTIAGDTFQSCPIANGTGYVYVPDDLVATYKAAANWVNVADQIKPLSELE